MVSPCPAYRACQSRNCGITFLQLYQPNVQNSTATTRPRRASIVSGALLIHLPAVISGAAVPGAGWAAVPPAPANVSSVTASVRDARRPHERGGGRRRRRGPLLPARRLLAAARRARPHRGRARRPVRRGRRLRAPLRRARVEPARDQPRQPHSLPPHAQLVRRPGDLRPRRGLPRARRVSRPAPHGGPRLLPAAQGARAQRARGRAGRDVGAPFSRARAVANALLHRLAARAVDARSGHRALRGALARVTTRWGAPKWPPTPPSVRRAPGNPGGSSLPRPPPPPAFVAPRQSPGAPRSPAGGVNHTSPSVREAAPPQRPTDYPGRPV